MILKRWLLQLPRSNRAPFLVLGLLLLYAVWPWLPFFHHPSRPRTLIFYGFSILAEVMNEGIFPAFQKEWQARTGERIEFISSFAGSGTVRNQLVLGVPAHLALLSRELDAEQLARAQVIPPANWRALPEHGVVNRTPFILLVRQGNPLGIADFSDLARPGVRVVHPDPLTSGGANWAVLAEYGAGLRPPGGSPEQGKAVLLGVWRNVIAQAASARAARTQFENGFGDALVTYEQELIQDRKRGKLKDELVYPRCSILSEHTLVVIPRNIRAGERDLVDAFTAFLWSRPAQAIFVRYGFRSVNAERNRGETEFGHIPDLATIQEFGGWAKAEREVIEGVWKSQVLKELGK